MKKAVVFDMDGVLIDSEGFWEQAEKEVFSSLGVILDSESCKLTQRMTTAEVSQFWYDKYPWNGPDLETVEELVIERVIQLIETKECEIKGVKEVLNRLKTMGLKIGLATNSPYKIIPSVLNKFAINDFFDVIVSAEFEDSGKPAPDVYLTALKKLQEQAQDCLAVEDSNSGILAAKRAGIEVIAFSNDNRNKTFQNADFVIHEYAELDRFLFIK